jgi:archaellum component FlaF (FlaF/FlaG flagellin family)
MQTIKIEDLNEGQSVFVSNDGTIVKTVFESYLLCGDTYRINFTDGSYTYIDKGSVLFCK